MCADKPGLLATISQSFSDTSVNITQAHCRATEDHRAVNTFHAVVGDLGQLKSVIRALSRINGFPAVTGCLQRVRPTPTQTGLNARQRRVNVRDAFHVTMPEWIRRRTGLWIDDGMTTGATVNECARVLKKAGASGVYVATVARG